MDTVGSLLEKEHRLLDKLFEEFRRALMAGNVRSEIYNEAAQVLRRHMYLEEEVLFPEVSAWGFEDPVAVLTREHGEIWRFLKGISELIWESEYPARILDALEGLKGLLEEHDFREERTLYPLADSLLDMEKALLSIAEASPPDGWVCRAHRSEG